MDETKSPTLQPRPRRWSFEYKRKLPSTGSVGTMDGPLHSATEIRCSQTRCVIRTTFSVLRTNRGGDCVPKRKNGRGPRRDLSLRRRYMVTASKWTELTVIVSAGTLMTKRVTYWESGVQAEGLCNQHSANR